MINKIIRNYLIKQTAGRADDGIMITLRDPQKVELLENVMADLLMRYGIDPKAITSEAQLKGFLNQIEAMTKQSATTSGIKNTQSAKVFDLEGNKLDPNKPIMGGTQEGMFDNIFNKMQNERKGLKAIDDDLPPPGSRGGPDDIAAPIQSAEESLKDMTEAEIKKKIQESNKKGIANIKKKLDDDPEKKADGGVAGLLGERSRYQRGGDVAFDAANEDIFGSSAISITPDTVMDQFGNQVQAEMGNTYNKPLIPQVTEQAANIKQSPLQSAAGIGGLPEIDMPVAGGNKNAGGILPVERDESFITQPFFPDSDGDGIDDRLSDEEKQRFLNPDEYRTLGPEIPPGAKAKAGQLIPIGPTKKADLRRIPDAEKNLDEVFQIDMTRPPGTPIGMEDSPLTVMPIYNNPLSQDQLLSGFEQFKKDNPEVMKGGGTAAIIPATLPGGYDYTFSGSLEANAFRKYLESIGQAPFRRTAQPIKGLKGFANGGRIGLKEGSGMTRRTFLKFLAGAASIPIIGKIFKPLKVGKTVSKVPIIKTGDVPGKPEWFDQLVNKVILEGDDVTKKFATQERQVVHMKKIDDDTSVTVTQDLNDGSIMVDVDDPIRNVMGETGDDTSVQMMLKKGQADETTKGTPADEFSFTEADMRNYMDGPDDYTTEFVENTVNKMSDLTSDLSKIESYATGKKLTMKQIVDSKKRRDMVELAERNPAEYAAGRGPDGPDFPEPDDFASGGIARMLGE